LLARAHAFTIDGFQTRHVTVEVDVRAGLPSFVIVGLADTAVREARERIGAAIRNSGFDFPARRITANLAPADVPKAGPGLDLALACALLAASEQISPRSLERVGLVGELGLDGALRPIRGTLAITEAAREMGLRKLALSPASFHEASLVGGMELAAVACLLSAVRVLGGGPPDRAPDRPGASASRPPGPGPTPDLADVRGQPRAVRALVIAAAGGHNLLLSGAPGTGKTLLARCLPSILPRLDHAAAIEVTRIHSLLGHRPSALVEIPPFRAPHHTVTSAGLVGGAASGSPGEVVLAHNGVLFLDELSEFPRSALEALRQPLEDGRVAIARAHHTAVYPARFMLVAATNPCPCGFAGEDGRCRCSDAELARHRRRLSGPLLDRVDVLALLRRAQPVPPGTPPAITSSRAGVLVLEARRRQAARLRRGGVALNAHADVTMPAPSLQLDGSAGRMLLRAGETGMLSARGQDRTLRVARTIADLDGRARVEARHMAEALRFSPTRLRAADRPTAARSGVRRRMP
jgi:magnesium chelatase family protein